ncbi:MAG: cupredoxin family copper-binding protein [Methylovulum sp.]|uniref:cupredoxin domain-containing protein n=1 Tax=Methylovulum sp. TaxID=1916980 RepID=UPI00261C5C4E|nr:cupredoxin family copper-binding protein [Methylovulum sp.]MDD2724406.1 cupredoxin family copper-binding protein [Methylovulum sp.]MDD5124009.1 cupredoxin family copper-binding protein [Methylovulum sp.]
MNRFTYPLLAFILMLASTSVFAKPVTVTIEGFAFKPATVTLDLGDSITWTNKDTATHNTTADNGEWASANLGKDQSFTRVFKTAGTFAYHCSIHPGMTGKITVRTAEETRVSIGKGIVSGRNPVLPITLDLAGKKAKQVYSGSYIVNAQGSCADCHSCPTYAAGHNPFKGENLQFNAPTYLAGGVQFGPFVSRNLTPNDKGRPAGMTLAQFKNTLRTGHSPNSPGSLLQVMPWPIYGKMSDTDLDAVYAYLSSIPSAVTPAPACANAGQ